MITRFSRAKPIRVIIVDDSALMRQILEKILSSDPEITVVDTAADPFTAREKIKKHNPDVITLDVEMPRMNGVDFLQKIMALRPMPVVMISSLTQEGTDTTLRALEIGAIDVIGKPQGFINEGMEDISEEIIAKVKSAAESRIQPLPQAVSRKRLSDVGPKPEDLITIGASTGGIPAIGMILAAMPRNAPPIVVAQHMPANFTPRFANRLHEACVLNICEGQDGEILAPGHAYIAPGGLMTRVEREGARYILRISSEPRVNGFCPSVDVLFESVAAAAGANAVGVLLTGMGHDGARGLLTLRKAGGKTIAQDQSSCVVYGMPRVAQLLGAVQHQLPLSEIPSALLEIYAHSTPSRGVAYVVS